MTTSPTEPEPSRATSLWECGDCSRPDSAKVKVDAVCHHCGILLCRTHQHRLLDPAFSSTPGEDQTAIHCVDCRNRHHRLAPFTVPVPL